jgi:hypothetical protein
VLDFALFSKYVGYFVVVEVVKFCLVAGWAGLESFKIPPSFGCLGSITTEYNHQKCTVPSLAGQPTAAGDLCDFAVPTNCEFSVATAAGGATAPYRSRLHVVA